MALAMGHVGIQAGAGTRGMATAHFPVVGGIPIMQAAGMGIIMADIGTGIMVAWKVDGMAEDAMQATMALARRISDTGQVTGLG